MILLSLALLSPHAATVAATEGASIAPVVMVVPDVPTNAFPGYCSVGLSWSPSSDSSVIGYITFNGVASRTYTNVMDAGSATSVSITNLFADGTLYFFAITSYNALGLQSDYSAEVAYRTPDGSQPPKTVLTLWWTTPMTNGIVEASGDAKHWNRFATVTGTNLVTMINRTNNVFFRLNGVRPQPLYFKAQ